MIDIPLFLEGIRVVVTWYGMDEGDEVHVEEFLYLRFCLERVGLAWLDLILQSCRWITVFGGRDLQPLLCMCAEHVLCDIEVVLHFMDR